MTQEEYDEAMKQIRITQNLSYCMITLGVILILFG